jgi:Bifunctional DNA primase/polymerase, N-terminal
MSTPLGATFNEWQHFDMILGLGDNLLPCVPASPDVRVLNGSALEGKVGKLPSQFNYAGEAHGLKDWQKREIMSNEIVHWSKDPRLNICVRTGQISGVYVFDIDVDDREKAEEIVRAIEAITGPLPKRWRENSGKCMLLFRCPE